MTFTKWHTCYTPKSDESQAVIGGELEVLTVPDEGRPTRARAQLVVDKDRVEKDLPVNAEATALMGQTVLGPALLLRGSQQIGDVPETWA